MTEHRPLIVTLHALERARERFRIDGENAVLTAYIDAEVRAGIAAGRIQNHKPKDWRLYGEKGRNLAPTERFVWNETNDRGWILRRSPTEDVVTTSLNRTGGISRLNRVSQVRR